MILGVPILKHFRISPIIDLHNKSVGPVETVSMINIRDNSSQSL